MKLDIYYSYACRDSYLVFKWLDGVKKSDQALDIIWRPFAIQMDKSDIYWKQPWATANSELRGFIAAESARQQGDEAFYRFHESLEIAVHEQLLELWDESTLIGAATRAGLDLDRFQADWYDSQLARLAERSHIQAAEQLNITGTPTLVFPNGRSFHIELNSIPTDSATLETFRAVEALAITHPHIRQLLQTNLSDR